MKDRKTSGKGVRVGLRARPAFIRGGSWLGKSIPGEGAESAEALSQELVGQV